MKYMTGFGRHGCFGLKPVRCAAIALSVAAAGCSADITRFDSASFNLNDPPQETAAVEPQRPEPGAADYANPVTRSQRPGPYGAGAVDVAALPDATPPPAASPAPVAGFGASAPPVAAAQAAKPQRPLYRPGGQRVAMAPAPQFTGALPAEAGKGDLIEVQPGDTLYGLSRRHQVSLAELMSVNGLTAPDLKPGQKLHLPAGKAARMAAATPAAAATAMPPPASAITAPPAAAAAPAPAPAVVSDATLAKYNGSYTVKPGDSLYAVARAHKVPFTELQQVNAIANPLKVKPGTVLKVPAGYSQTAAATPAAAAAPLAAAVEAAPANVAPAMTQPAAAATAPANIPAGSAQPTIINAAKPAETVAPVAPATAAEQTSKGDKLALNAPAQPAAPADTSKLRWPAQGKIIAGFGGRPDGTHNDGINLSVPLGTDVHAAESGVVAYAGSELKGYGNLVLVRHDNGWVTAYAHNEELIVKRGDKVKRGQVIAKAGKSGTVDQPQVHFELRQGSKPVDPTPFMEKL